MCIMSRDSLRQLISAHKPAAPAVLHCTLAACEQSRRALVQHRQCVGGMSQAGWSLHPWLRLKDAVNVGTD